MRLNREQAEELYPGVKFLGDSWVIGQDAVIGQGVWIEQDAVIGQGVRIGQDALIREGANILSVRSIFNCNIVPCKDHVEIKIGCVCETVETWENGQFEIAEEQGEVEWYQEKGQYIYQFLKGEADRYTAKYLK